MFSPSPALDPVIEASTHAPSSQASGVDILDLYVQKVTRGSSLPPTPPIPDEPPGLFGNQRRLTKCPPPDRDTRQSVNLPRFRDAIRDTLRSYMQTPDPGYMLLIPAPPGSGKTWAGVDFAHWSNRNMDRDQVFYAGPRRDFFLDVQATAMAQGQDETLWLKWQPRRKDDEDPKEHTCNWAEEISTWMGKGYEGMNFCERVCGWDYIGRGCPYHAQRERTEPLIYGHHLHAFLGHPRMTQFSVMIGDELPLNSVVHDWLIPSKHLGQEMDYDEPMTHLMVAMRRLCEEGKKLHGPDLLEALGGADDVLSTLATFRMKITDVVVPPTLPKGHGEKAFDAPVAFLPTFAAMLGREAQAALGGQGYPERIYLNENGLNLLTRRYLNEHVPKHLIWFDATGSAGLYEAMFGRQVRTLSVEPKLAGRIYQVTNRANGKSSLLKYQDGDDPEPTPKVSQLKSQINAIVRRENAKNPAVITYQKLTDLLDYPASHFYGSRGTNEFEGCDVLIVAGTPMPPLYQIEKVAKALYPERMRPFDTRWYALERAYNFTDVDEDGNEHGWQYPISIFADPELNRILWQFRDGEVIQAAHRARILFRDVPVYLLTNLPIDELPPDDLLTIPELLGAPEGVDAFLWSEMLYKLEDHVAEHGPITISQIMELAGVSKPTALKYRDILTEQYGWGISTVTDDGRRGRPAKKYAP